MEQRKVLLIIISVAIALAAIVGVGLWLFYPRGAEEGQLAQGEPAGEEGFEWQPLDYLQGQGDVPGLEEDAAQSSEQSDEFEVTYGVVQGDQAGSEGPGSEGLRPVIESAPSAAAGTRPAAGAGSEAPATSTRETTVASQPAASATPSATATTTSAPAGSAGSAAPAATTQSPELADRAYWVQAISSPNRDTIEQAQITLKEHQLGSRILTREIDGRTYFRLRIGPFAVRAEAEKFLGWVQNIDDFSDAMIFVDYTTPVLAARPR